jgi:hypothetical protein
MDNNDYLSEQAAEWERYRTTYTERESLSGPGSSLDFTQNLRAWLPDVFVRYDIRTMLDAPCGDWNWMRHVDLRYLHRYVGLDVNQHIIIGNRQRHQTYSTVVFQYANILTTGIHIDRSDLILCRDLLQHLPNDQVTELLSRFQASGSRYLMVTNFHAADNDTTQTHDEGGFYYRPIDLEKPPFSLTSRTEELSEPDDMEPGREMVLFQL